MCKSVFVTVTKIPEENNLEEEVYFVSWFQGFSPRLANSTALGPREADHHGERVWWRSCSAHERGRCPGTVKVPKATTSVTPSSRPVPFTYRYHTEFIQIMDSPSGLILGCGQRSHDLVIASKPTCEPCCLGTVLPHMGFWSRTQSHITVHF